MSHFRCHVSGVRCHFSMVRCHLSHVTNANSHSHGPSRFCIPYYAQYGDAADHDQNQWKLCHCRPILGLCSLTRILPDTEKWVFCDGTATHTHTDIPTLWLNWLTGPIQWKASKYTKYSHGFGLDTMLFPLHGKGYKDWYSVRHLINRNH